MKLLKDEIERLILQGLHREALKKVDFFHRKYPLTAEHRLAVSTWFFKLGKPIQALKVCGKELSTDLYPSADKIVLQLQFQRAHYLGYFGAHITAGRIFKNIEKRFQKEKLVESSLGFLFYRFLGLFYIRQYLYLDAKVAFRMALKYADGAISFD